MFKPHVCATFECPRNNSSLCHKRMWQTARPSAPRCHKRKVLAIFCDCWGTGAWVRLEFFIGGSGADETRKLTIHLTIDERGFDRAEPLHTPAAGDHLTDQILFDRGGFPRVWRISLFRSAPALTLGL